jgi:hypothetical protein
MHSMSTVAYVLWLASPLLQSTIVIIMLKNRLYRELPVFFWYAGFHVFRSFVLLLIRNSGNARAYGIGYWVAELLSVFLGFAVIYELFSHVLKRYEGIRQLGLMLLRWACFVLTLVAIISTSTSTSGDFAIAMGAILALERSVRIIQCGLVVFLFLFASTLALSWRHYAFGIALGFGLFASVELILVAVRAQIGPSADSTYILLKPVTYVCACMFWNQAVLELLHQ